MIVATGISCVQASPSIGFPALGAGQAPVEVAIRGTYPLDNTYVAMYGEGIIG